MSSASSQTRSSALFASMKIDHVGLRAEDFDAAVAWYEEKLDFRLKQSWPMGDNTFGFISPAADDNFSFELIAGPGATSRPAYKDLGSSLKLAGWHHVCFHVQSVDDTVAELKSRGVTIINEPTDVAEINLRFAFFADPWGNLFEIAQSTAE